MPDRSALTMRVSLAALLGVALLCAALGAFAWASRPPVLRSHDDLVAYALRERGVAYERIALGEVWPDRTNLQYGSYVGPVTRAVAVRLAGGGGVSGWLECRSLDEACKLTIAELQIDDAPLPEMGAPDPPEWLRWLSERLPWLFEA